MQRVSLNLGEKDRLKAFGSRMLVRIFRRET
jgi:hypothetical protein